MRFIDEFIGSGGAEQEWPYTIGDTFVAPETGWYFVDGCGAGANGEGSAGGGQGGGAGAGARMFPVFLTKGQAVTVTIGAGGVTGGSTSFGSFLTLPGGGSLIGGLNKSASTNIDEYLNGSAHPCGFLIAGANGGQVSGGYTAGGNSTFFGGTGASGAKYWGGGGGGMYGPGGNANSAGAGVSAAANSGAGGGAGSTTGGAGGSGYLVVRRFK